MRCLTLSIITTVLFACMYVDATACGGSILTENMFQPDPDAVIEFIRPAPDGSQVLRDDFLQIFVSYSETRSGALTALDHIHYGIALLEAGTAQQGEFTLPDLTGQVEIFLSNPEQNGTYEVCAYLARADHTHLSETACTTFVLATSGMRVFLPREELTYRTAEIPLEFETYGTDVASIRYTIGNGEPQELSTLDTETHLPPLKNGSHTLIIEAFNAEGVQLGTTITRTFYVNSALTIANAQKLKRLITRTRKHAVSGASNNFHRKALKLVKKMNKSGSISAETAALDAASIKKISKLLRQSKKRSTIIPLRKALRLLNNILDS